MAKQIYYEDVEAVTEITPLAKIATTQMLIRWGGAVGAMLTHCTMKVTSPKPRGWVSP